MASFRHYRMNYLQKKNNKFYTLLNILLAVMTLIFIITNSLLQDNEPENGVIHKNQIIIDSLKYEITKRDSLIHNIHENLKDILTGVDNAPVSFSHSAIINYLDTRR